MFSVGLSEIVLIVEDVPRAARFYRQVVGLVPETEPDESWAWFWAGQPGRHQRIALHRGALGFEQHSPHPPGARWGHVHLAFEVPPERAEAAVAHVRSQGVEVHGPVDLGWMNATAHLFYDPDGNMLEFWTPRADER